MSEQKKSFEDLDAVKILVESLEKFNDEERMRIIKWACERMGMKNAPSIKDVGYSLGVSETTSQIQPDQSITKSRGVDIKRFVNEKNPSSDAQFVAVVAYYFKFEAPEDQKKEFIISEDLNEAARLSDRSRFQKPAATLNNVYNKSGYLDRVDSGKYKLNTVGENLVAMVLPDNNDGRVVKKKKRNRIEKKVTKKKSKK
ncbi:MAG: hypothetical protein WCW77_01145 [Patescibacteria group bacterium]|jgi:hypothetical protein